MYRTSTSLAFALVAVLAASTATATPLDALQAPTWDDVAYDGQTNTIALTWNPPGQDSSTSFTYRVFRNGVVVDTTTTTTYAGILPPPYSVFYVVAEHDGQESPPSMPVIIQSRSSYQSGGAWNTLFSHGAVVVMEGGGCPIIVNVIRLDEPPFLFPFIRPECIPIIGPALDSPLTMDTHWRYSS